MNNEIKTSIETLQDIRIPIHAYRYIYIYICDHNMAEVLKKVDATITALTASADSTSAQDERSAFEQWVKRESNLFDLTLAPKMTCKDGRFPATYFDSEIETAWRAWANKPRASLASNLQAGEPVAWMWTRHHANGGYTRELCHSKAAAEALCERFTLGGTYDVVTPLYAYPTPQAQQYAGKDAAVAAIQFALEADEGWIFLRRWSQGDFDICRRDWPEAPEVVYIGADPLYKKAAPAQPKVCIGCLHGLGVKDGKHTHASGIYAGDCTAQAVAQQSKPFNSKCCHKTVTKRCDGCPYDE